MAGGVADKDDDGAAAGAKGDGIRGNLEEGVDPVLGFVAAAAGGEGIDGVLEAADVGSEAFDDLEPAVGPVLVDVAEADDGELGSFLGLCHGVDDGAQVALDVLEGAGHGSSDVDDEDNIGLGGDLKRLYDLVDAKGRGSGVCGLLDRSWRDAGLRKDSPGKGECHSCEGGDVHFVAKVWGLDSEEGKGGNWREKRFMPALGGLEEHLVFFPDIIITDSPRPAGCMG